MLDQITRIILLVDDSSDDVFLFSRLLLKAGVTNPVFPILDSEDALAFFDRAGAPKGGVRIPLVCFLDINMPRVNGFEVLRRIRSKDVFNQMCVVMLSTSADPRDLRMSAQLGAQCHVLKPLSAQTLQEVIGRAVSYSTNSSTNPSETFAFAANQLRGKIPGNTTSAGP